MMVHTTLFTKLMRKQITSMSNPTIPRKLSRKFQDLLKKDYPAYLQQKKYLKIRKITMNSIYGNAVTTKNKIIQKKTTKQIKNLVSAIYFGSTHLTVNQLKLISINFSFI